MLVTRRNSEWMPSVFNDFFDTNWMAKSNATAPAINVIETEKDYKVEIAAAGMSKDDFTLKVNDDNCLEIVMEKKAKSEKGDEKSRYLRREFSYTKFQQNLVLPDDVEKDKITAKVENGVLNVDLPKRAPETKTNASRAIEVF